MKMFAGLTVVSLLALAACGGGNGTGGAGGMGGSAGAGGEGGAMGGAGGAMGGAGGAMGGAGGAAPAPTCAEYCGLIQAACTGANGQYASEAICLASCEAFDVGTAADTSGNTLGCRIYHATAAAGGPDVHCTHAGPGGDGACGNNCEGFCAIAQDACTGDNAQYADEAACLAECSGFPADTKYNTNQTAGDSLACRLYHLTVAATDPAVHCSHIVADSPTCL
jgi:hypothetical protein